MCIRDRYHQLSIGLFLSLLIWFPFPSTSHATQNTKDLYLILLRQPRSTKTEMRTDPFWETGSFGLTGCHKCNLLHPKNLLLLKNSEIGFVQGGPDGMKLVHLVNLNGAQGFSDRLELTWDSALNKMPLKYSNAIILINNNGESDIKGFPKSLRSVNRNTWVARFASAYRSRSTPLDKELAQHVRRTFQRFSRRKRAGSYIEAMHAPPPRVDTNRLKTQRQLRKKLSAR